MTNYIGQGTTKAARRERRVDPRFIARSAIDHRFHTLFQQDYYTSVILTKNPIVSVSQWIDWKHARNQHQPSLDLAIVAL